MHSFLLIKIYAEQAVQNALAGRSKGIRLNGSMFNNIRYADDTVIFADNKMDLQILMARLNEES